MFSSKKQEEYEEVQEWVVEYLVKREKVWARKNKKLIKKGMIAEDRDLEKLCFDADSFHLGWGKFEELGLEGYENDIEDLYAVF